MKTVVITSAVRTPVGAYLGSLKTLPPEELGRLILEEVVKRSGINSDIIEHVIMGDVLSHMPNIARISALLAGYPIEIPAYSVDRQCGSSLQAVINGYQLIVSEDADVVVAGGTESMSRGPYYLPDNVRYEGFRAGDFRVQDAFAFAVENAHPPAQYPNLNMGLTAENVAAKYGISRELQDTFALDSQSKYKAAFETGKFKDEILPITVKDRRTSFIFDTDEHPKLNISMEKLSILKPVFLKDANGTVTPGNSSGMNDGASAIVMMSMEKANSIGVKPLAKIVSTATYGVNPEYMGLGPVPAIRKALSRAGLLLDDIDLFEINEAFAAQSLGCLIELGMNPGTESYNKVNVNGGAIAHGHALANSGTRILTTLVHELRRRGGRFGVASLCIGGGQGIAVVIENID